MYSIYKKTVEMNILFYETDNYSTWMHKQPSRRRQLQSIATLAMPKKLK